MKKSYTLNAVKPKLVDDLREEYADIQDKARLELGEKLTHTIWEVKDKISFVKNTPTHPH